MKHWYYCPICKQKLLKIDPSKHIEGVYVKCKKCKQEIQIIYEPEPEPIVKTI